MRRVKRASINAGTAAHLAVLFLLLRDVVVVWAKGLPVGAIPKQFLIAFVRHYVVNDQMRPPRIRLQRSVKSEVAGIHNSMSLTATAKLVAGLREEDGAGLLPLRRISPFPRGRSARKHSAGSASTYYFRTSESFQRSTLIENICKY